MDMHFDQKEIADILKEFVTREYKIPQSAVKDVTFSIERTTFGSDKITYASVQVTTVRARPMYPEDEH